MVERDGALRDEVSGQVLTGHGALLMLRARRARFSGYHTMRDDALTERSDAALFRFLDRIASRMEAPSSVAGLPSPATP